MQTKRHVDVCAVDIMSVAAEDIGEFVVSCGVEQAEYTDTQRTKLAPREPEI